VQLSDTRDRTNCSRGLDEIATVVVQIVAGATGGRAT